MDLTFQHPCTALVVGSTGAGKTHWIKKVIEHREDMFDITFEKIIFHYSEWQPLYEDLPFVDFRPELPLMGDHSPGQAPKLIIIDYLWKK